MNTNPYAPPQATVQDLPNTTSEPAGRGTRLVAVFLDGIILTALVYIPMGISIKMSGHPLILPAHAGQPPQFNYLAMFYGRGVLLPLIGLIIWSWLTILYVSRNGQSIAKKMMGIKVVRKDGSKASLGRIFLLRNVVNIILAFVPLYGLVDCLLIFGEDRQCVHDKLADTIVVRA
jgi:uncharacterized RDD family membrane protein YckC